MSTDVRPELSEKNKYWIERHRYYELKHFCLQYPSWKKTYLALDGFNKHHISITTSKTNDISDVTARNAMMRMFYQERMDMVEYAATMADPDLASYILKAVTEGLSFTNLKSRLEIPCSKDTYYDRYRRFFWLLSNARN